jgi:hypothetical protein
VGAALAAALASTLHAASANRRLDGVRSIEVSSWESRFQPATIRDGAEIASIVSELRSLPPASAPPGWHGTSKIVLRREGADDLHAEAVLEEGGLIGVLDGFGGFEHFRLNARLRERLIGWLVKAVAASKHVELGSVPGAWVSYEERLLVHRVHIEFRHGARTVDAWILGRDGRSAPLVDRQFSCFTGGVSLDFDNTLSRDEITAVVVSVEGVPRVFRLAD